MSSLQLNPSQKRILTSLVNLAEGEETTVRGKDIAERVDRNPGTIRNQMQSLKALQLVEGVRGPKGGYKPTVTAYQTLDVNRIDEPAHVPVEHNGEPITNITVEEINLSSVHHPELCRAEIVLRGPVPSFQEEDRIAIGPTPTAKLNLEGVVDDVNETENVLIVRLQTMKAPTDSSKK